MYKKPVFTPEMTHRFTKDFCLKAMGQTEQELREMATLGAKEAEALLVSVEQLADEQVNYYHPKGKL
jgi:hypothetical protein